MPRPSKHNKVLVTISTRIPPHVVSELETKFPGMNHTEILKTLVDAALNEKINWDRAGFQAGLRRGQGEALRAIEAAMAKVYREHD